MFLNLFDIECKWPLMSPVPMTVPNAAEVELGLKNGDERAGNTTG